MLTRGQYLARTALTYRGVRYRWGGRSRRTGFDCSGLVQKVCAKWGVYLPRVARAQYRVGRPVPRKRLAPGDLVFFKNTYRRGLSHVGIFVGNGLFIHAAGRGQGVVVSRLLDPYNLNHWAGARRLDLSRLPPAPEERAQLASFTGSGETGSTALPEPARAAPAAAAIPAEAPAMDPYGSGP